MMKSYTTLVIAWLMFAGGLFAADWPNDMSVQAWEQFKAKLEERVKEVLANEYREQEERLKLLADPYTKDEKVSVQVIRGTSRTLSGIFHGITGSGTYAQVHIGPTRVPLQDLDPLDQERLLLGMDMKTVKQKIEQKRSIMEEEKARRGAIIGEQLKREAGYTEEFFRNTVQLGDRFWRLEELGEGKMRVLVRTDEGNGFARVIVYSELNMDNLTVAILDKQPVGSSFPLLDTPVLPLEKQPEDARALVEIKRTLQESGEEKKTPAPDGAAEEEEPADEAAPKDEMELPLLREIRRRPIDPDTREWDQFEFRIKDADVTTQPARVLNRYFRLYVVRAKLGSWSLDPERFRPVNHRGRLIGYGTRMKVRAASVRPPSATMIEDLKGVLAEVQEYQATVAEAINETRKAELKQLADAARDRHEELRARLKARQQREDRSDQVRRIMGSYGWLIAPDGKEQDVGNPIGRTEFKSMQLWDTSNLDRPRTFDNKPVTNLTDWNEVRDGLTGKSGQYEVNRLRWRLLQIDDDGQKTFYLQYALTLTVLAFDEISIRPQVTIALKDGTTRQTSDTLLLEPNWFGVCFGRLRLDEDTLMAEIDKVQLTIEIAD